MGGSVLVRACPMLQENKYRITGVAVLDVVEGIHIKRMRYASCYISLTRNLQGRPWKLYRTCTDFWTADRTVSKALKRLLSGSMSI